MKMAFFHFFQIWLIFQHFGFIFGDNFSYDASLAVVGIMTAPSGVRASERRQAVWESWANIGLNNPQLSGQMFCVFIIGLSNTTDLRVMRDEQTAQTSTFNPNHKFDDELPGLPVLTVPVMDGYNAVVEKLIHFSKWTVEHTNCLFLVKADDDTFVRLDLLGNMLLSQRTNGLYYGQFCTGAPTRLKGHKNFVPSVCYPLASYPPYAHGGMYSLSRDLASFISHNAMDFAKGTINRCIETHCAHHAEDCENQRGTLPSLEDVQVAMWLMPMRVKEVHDHRLVPLTGCNENAVAIWDVPPHVMKDMGYNRRLKLRTCTLSLFEYAADNYLVHSIHSAFGKDEVHVFPRGHQVYSVYFTYFFSLVRAARWADALRVWDTASNLNSQTIEALQNLAKFIQTRMALDGCATCTETLVPLLDKSMSENGRELEVCSSTSGNVDTIDRTLLELVKHIRSEF